MPVEAARRNCVALPGVTLRNLQPPDPAFAKWAGFADRF